MKTFLKVLGTTALLASVVPFSYDKDELTGQKTVQALLWKLTSKPGSGGEGSGREVEIELGFNNPFAGSGEDEALLFEDGLDNEPAAPEASTAPETPAAPEVFAASEAE